MSQPRKRPPYPPGSRDDLRLQWNRLSKRINELDDRVRAQPNDLAARRERDAVKPLADAAYKALIDAEQKDERRRDLKTYIAQIDVCLDSWSEDQPEWLDPRTLQWVADKAAAESLKLYQVYRECQVNGGTNRNFLLLIGTRLFAPLATRLRLRAARIERRRRSAP